MNGNNIPINEKITGKRIEAMAKNIANANMSSMSFITTSPDLCPLVHHQKYHSPLER